MKQNQYGEPLLREQPLFYPDYVYDIVFQDLKEEKGEDHQLLSEDIKDTLELETYRISSVAKSKAVTNLAIRDGLISFEVMTYGNSKAERRFLSLSYVYSIRERGSREDWAKEKLLKAIRTGHWYAFESLIEKVNLEEEDGAHPLNEAVRYGRLSMVEEMLKRGIKADKHYDETVVYDWMEAEDINPSFHSPISQAFHPSELPFPENCINRTKNQAMIDLLKRYGAKENSESKVDHKDED